METVHKGLRVRIYPDTEQTTLINKTLGCSRFIYNQMLNERIEVYEKLKDNKRELYEYKYKTEKQYKEEYEWLKEVDSTALQQSRMNLGVAYTNFFKSLKGKRKGKKVGFPKFKKKKNTNKYRSVMNIRIDYQNNKIKLPKVGWVNFKHRNIKDWYKGGRLKSITITKTPTGKYFATMLIENTPDFTGIQKISNNPKTIGLDMSLDKFYVDNLGKTPSKHRRFFREEQKRLRREQRRKSRKQKGSKNAEKQRRKVARVHEDIKNKRSDFVHKLSKSLVNNYDVIVVESLSLAGMARALKLGKSVHDLGYSEFVRQLQYKCLWNDKTLIKADQWFASSKTCSFCGHKNKGLLLHERKWTCPSCGTELERDQNAGVNLNNYGLKFLGLEQPKFTPSESLALACGKSISETSDVEQGSPSL